MIPLALGFSLLLGSFLAYGGENARITITLHEVPIGDEIETQIYVSWGARIPKVPASWLQRHNFRDRAGRSTGTLKHTTETIQIDSKITSFIIYGRIVTSNGKTIRVIPAKFFEVCAFKSLAQLTPVITPRRSFEEAFLDSYPLEFQSDQGFLSAENVRPTLRSFRHMVDYAGETNSQVSEEVWNRMHTFFNGNRKFFRRGGSMELSEVLEYLKTYTAASRAPGVANFYAEFLNGLVGLVSGTVVFDEDITDYLHGQQMQLYETRLFEAFSQADISLQKFHDIGRNEGCLLLAEKILRALDDTNLENAIRRFPRNLNSILLQTTVCGQYHFERDSGENGATHLSRRGGARFLAKSQIGRPTITEYVRVCRFLESKGKLTLQSTGVSGEIAKYCIDYNQALEGGF
jgi:hypothetical protein